MASVGRKYSNSKDVVFRFNQFVKELTDEIKKEHPQAFVYSLDGTFYTKNESIGFDSDSEYKEIVKKVKNKKIEMASFYCNISEAESEYSRPTIVAIHMDYNSFDGIVKLDISKNSYSTIEVAFQCFEDTFPDSKVQKSDPENEITKLEKSEVNKCINILLNFPDLQTRIRKEFETEKDVQDFMYPVLKSNFSDLVDEEFLPKVAGTTSKPDFAFQSSSVVIECKFLRDAADFKRFKDEIAADLVGYFGQGSNYKYMIVFIYNGANMAPPANYIADLESCSENIVKVIISPGLKPHSKKGS